MRCYLSPAGFRVLRDAGVSCEQQVATEHDRRACLGLQYFIDMRACI